MFFSRDYEAELHIVKWLKDVNKTWEKIKKND